ncbi:MAG: NAD(+) diphosphatase [Rhodobacteraceae bacterium]|nr:NAD(+) diphosphatase [Paracoccaceae bacterium]
MSFVGNTLDRCATKRNDLVWIEEQLADPNARFVLATPKQLVLDTSGETPRILHSLERAYELGASKTEIAFLGMRSPEQTPIFAATIALRDEDLETFDGLSGQGLRTLAIDNNVSAEELGYLAQANALLHWHRSHKFCSACGQPTYLAEGGYRRHCHSCETDHFPRTDPCVIMLILKDDKALLGRPARLAEGVYTTLAGFMEPGETIEQAVRRETLEESNIKVGQVRILANQPWPFPANLMVGCVGEALSDQIAIEQDELEACKWCDRDEVRQMLERTHPEGHFLPPAISIAHHLIVDWLEGRTKL